VLAVVVAVAAVRVQQVMLILVDKDITQQFQVQTQHILAAVVEQDNLLMLVVLVVPAEEVMDLVLLVQLFQDMVVLQLVVVRAVVVLQAVQELSSLNGHK
jgi:hypothetical protein